MPSAKTNFIGNFLGHAIGGLSLGVGLGVGSRAVDAVTGPRTVRIEVVGTEKCNIQVKELQDCLNAPMGDPDRCSQHFENMLKCTKP